MSAHYPETTATIKGHLKKQRSNVRSTKLKTSKEKARDEIKNETRKEIWVKVFGEKDTIYTDQTGNLPIVSSRGNSFLMILYNVDANFIDAEPLKDHTDASLIKAYEKLWNRLTQSGVVKPRLHILNNEVSVEMKNKIRENCEF